MSLTLDQIKEKIFSKYKKENWEIKTLGEISREIISGNEISKEQLNTGSTPAIKYIGKSTPLQITRGEDLVDENLIKKKKYCEFGDILFAKFNRIQKIAGRSSVYLGKEKCLVGAGVIVLKHNQNPKFLSYILTTDFVRKQMDLLLQESIVFQLYPRNLKQLKIPLPSLEIQNEIVEFLDKFTELERELEKELESRKQQYEYYKNLIFDRGIHELKWEVKTLEEISTNIYIGSEIKRDQLGTGNYPAIKCGDVNSLLPIKFEKCVSFVDEKLIKTKRYFEYGDILIGKIGDIRTSGTAVAYLGREKCLLGDAVYSLKHGQNPSYLAYLLSTRFVRRQIEEFNKGGTVFNFFVREIKQIKVPIPSLEEQKRVVEVLDKLYSITGDIKEGIPLLIQKNKEQYNFYKELILEK